MNKKGFNKFVLIPIVVTVLFLALGITLISKGSSSGGNNAVSKIAKEAQKIGAKEMKHGSLPVSTTDSLSVAQELPDIDLEYPLVVQGNGDIDIEIWTSPEKGGSGKDNFLVEVANAFNREKHTKNGKTLSVSIRSIASGVAVDYMSSGKECPDLYTPSNHLWGELALEDGIDIHVEKEVLVENTAGILVNNAKYKELKNDSTNVDFDTIYQAVLNDQLSVGYPNPYSSSTGMNFLIHALYSCDSDNVLSDQAIEQFQAFQNKVALTSFTTQQLVKSAENGTVDCLVMEYQQYINDGTLQTKYKFVPFGYKHNNPVYSIGKVEEEKQEGIDLFLKECDKNEALASRNGFNKNLDYQENLPAIDGNTIKAAQSIWKETKDNGTSVLIEFVFDISGSMESNNRYENLKTAFLNSMDYINSENYVGVISYDGKVYKDVAMDKMNITQKGKIKGALTEISPAGKTAMYDAIVVAMDELHKKEAELSDQSVKKVVVVLTDGVSNAGRNDYDSCESLISNAGIPVYTISYDYDTYDLQRIADINEAEYINGTSEDIILKLKNLFQAIA